MSLSPEREPYTDLGNAKRLAARCRKDARYIPAWGCWLIYDGQRWRRDEHDSLMQRAKGVVRNFYRQASAMENDELRKAASNHARRSEQLGRLRAMIELAQSEPEISMAPSAFDRDPWLFNCRNGTIDLHTGELRPHERTDYVTKMAPVIYDPEARHELWERFLDQITGGDSERREYLQRVAGYGLTGLTSEEIFVVLWGPPYGGKTTFLEALKSTMGGYAATAEIETFLRQNQARGPRNDLARLRGARLVGSSEVPSGRQFDEAMVKQLTGGDTITVRFLYKEPFEYRPQFLICIAANHLPVVRDDDPAIWRRIKIVPFEHPVSADRVDPQVKARLIDPNDAGPAILAWCVQGTSSWRENGLREPVAVQLATNTHRDEMATFSQFIEDCCFEGPEQWVATKRFLGRYRSWSAVNGYRYPYGPQRLKQLLRNRSHVPEKRGGVRGWRGIGIIDAA